MSASGIITLTTDFGLADPYVAAMKGVILSLNPGAELVDISHLIPAQDVFAAAFTLSGACLYFPQGTVHLGVVDPGVGGARRPIAVFTNDHFFVGPDNGLFSEFLNDKSQIIELTNQEFFLKEVSGTFNGRDIFAPVAAHLSLGVQMSGMGTPIGDPVKLNWPRPLVRSGLIIGQVLRIDRFGNLITNIPVKLLPPSPVVNIMGRKIKGLSGSYSATEGATLLAIIGSYGLLEIATPNGSAAQELRITDGDKVEIIIGEE